ncbi:SAM-dependent methyltransferase [Amycolatopsis sp. NPDC088138]|uniref:SAM-dependent methyltransferase n=1 Tax=Amycolatopsis sp. NPDC088138 TaxID=3363938 RepID=UPI003827EF0C
MDLDGIDAIGRTAFEVALLRAAEDRRPDRLFADPCARLFLEAAGITEEKPDFAALMGPQVAVRTRFLDDALLSGEARQVVLVASGMDGRPWRLGWPGGTEVFEIDQAPVLRFKDAAAASLTARCVRRPVVADLREDWAVVLREAGFRPDRPTAWLTEGLLYALDEAAAEGLLATISGLSAAGSTLAFDHVETSAALRAAIGPDLARLWRSGPVDPARWLTRHGWEPDVTELADIAAKYGRRIHSAYDLAAGGTARAWLGRAVFLGRER